MNQNLPETDLHSRIQELERRLRLAEQGASRLAQRNLALQQELEAMAALSPQMELPKTRRCCCPSCFYDAGFGVVGTGFAGSACGRV